MSLRSKLARWLITILVGKIPLFIKTFPKFEDAQYSSFLYKMLKLASLNYEQSSSHFVETENTFFNRLFNLNLKVFYFPFELRKQATKM